MVNQICIAGLVQGLSEGISFGLNAGLNMEDVIEVISKGAAQSWQMENRSKTMIDDKFNFGKFYGASFSQINWKFSPLRSNFISHCAYSVPEKTFTGSSN